MPTNVRQRYLHSIIDECLKISGGDELAAQERAGREEADCNRWGLASRSGNPGLQEGEQQDDLSQPGRQLHQATEDRGHGGC